MPIELLQSLKSDSLFLPTPLLETPLETAQLQPSINEISKLLTIALESSSTISQRESYRQFIHIAELSKSCILSLELASETSVLELYQFWEIRLSSLLFANELSIAQSESKRLSEKIDELLPKLTSDIEKPLQYSVFPNNLHYSLRLLIIRLRSIGPGKLVDEEYLTQLWATRFIYLNFPEKKETAEKLISVLFWGISSSLIAKRKYFSYLNNADNVIETYMSCMKNKSRHHKDFKDRILLVNTLVLLLIGDADNASIRFSEIENIKPILDQLVHLLNTISPVLDKKVLSTHEPQPKPETEKIKLDHSEVTVDDLFELVKDQLITGRILCSLCASFEIELRDNEGDDILNSYRSEDLDPSFKEVQRQLLRLWREKTYRLYAFE